MCWPQLIGSLEIEERRPRSWNEPRRKRLNFVRDRKRDSDEWTLVAASPGHNRLESQQKLWDRRKWEANQRFLAQEDHRLRQRDLRLRQDHDRYMLQQPVPAPPLQSWPDPRMQPLPPTVPHHGGPHGGPHETDDRGHHHGNNGDEIVAVISSSDDSDDDHNHRSPRVLEAAPSKHFNIPRSRSRGRKAKKKSRPISLFSDDSSSEDDFTQGFRAGRKASISRIPLSRRGRSRSRSRIFELSDDSFEDLDTRKRSRSKSRSGRRR